MRKFIVSILFVLIAAGVPTSASAIKLEIFVNGVSVVSTELSTPSDTACTVGPCTFTRNVTIADGDHGGVLNVVGGFAQAKVETNNTTIATSTSVINTLNVSGTFKYIGPVVPTTGATIEFVTSNRFNLRTGVWTTPGRGGFKCKLNTNGTYGPAACSLTSSTVQSGTCTLCRAFGYTDEGYGTRPDLFNPLAQLPASGVKVTMSSEVGFENLTATLTVPQQVGGSGGSLEYLVPPSSIVEDGHFYLGDSVSQNFACEPLKDGNNNAFTCADNENKTSKLRFTNIQPNDVISLPVTGTDIGAPDPGVLAVTLTSHIPIDVHPIGPVFDSALGGFRGGANNDWNVGSSGQRQVVALSTSTIDACAIEPFDLTDPDNPVPLVFLSVAGSDPSPTLDTSADLRDFDFNGTCDGRVFSFDMQLINATITGTTPDEKQATCIANPTATLLVAGVNQVVEYDVPTGKGGKKATYTTSSECVTDSRTGQVTCTVSAEVGGTQIVRCSTPSGGI